MSKLVDRLEQIAKGTPRAMGFAAMTKQEAVPTLALLAWVSDPAKHDLAAVAGAGADALVLPHGAAGGNARGKNAQALEGLTWGAAAEGVDRDQTEEYKAKGCDFLVFGIDGTLVDALEEGEVGRVLRIPSTLDEALMRGLEDLPVDVLMLRRPTPEGPLGLAHLLAISNVRTAMSRYLLLEWDADLSSRELEHLRDLGVDGLVLDVDKLLPDALAALRERIDKLPPRKPRTEQRAVPMLPRAGELGPGRARRHEEEEEEEEEEFDLP